MQLEYYKRFIRSYLYVFQVLRFFRKLKKVAGEYRVFLFMALYFTQEANKTNALL